MFSRQKCIVMLIITIFSLDLVTNAKVPTTMKSNIETIRLVQDLNKAATNYVDIVTTIVSNNTNAQQGLDTIWEVVNQMVETANTIVQTGQIE